MIILSMTMSITTIKLDSATRDRLKHVCLKDETYADKVNDLLDKYEKGREQ